MMRSLAWFVWLLLLLPGCQSPKQTLYPLGIYAVPEGELATVQEAGFGLVTGPAQKTYLDSADRLGLKVLASAGTSAGPRFNPEQAHRAVGQFDAHPALWSWYLVDEPDLNQIPPADVQAAERTFKQAGSRKPTALVLYQGAEAQNYANIADITMVDRYPIPWLPLANFPQHVRLARLAAKEKPLIAVIQAFDWKYYPKLLPGKQNLRPPTYDELRCMTYCALARRATGLFYYCYNDGAWRMHDHPDVWESLKKIIAEVREYEPLFRAEHVWWPYVHAYPDPATGFNEALESSISPTLLHVPSGNGAVPPGRYLLTVNTTRRSLAYRIRLPRENAVSDVAVVGEKRSVAVSNNWLEDNFGPLDVHIYGPLPDHEQKEKGKRGS